MLFIYLSIEDVYFSFFYVHLISEFANVRVSLMLLQLNRLQVLILLLNERLLVADPRTQIVDLRLLHGDLLILGEYGLLEQGQIVLQVFLLALACFEFGPELLQLGLFPRHVKL